jgi:hypothetical protein
MMLNHTSFRGGHEYVNMLSAIEIGDGDKLLAVPQPRSLHSGIQKPDDHLVGGNDLIIACFNYKLSKYCYY